MIETVLCPMCAYPIIITEHNIGGFVRCINCSTMLHIVESDPIKRAIINQGRQIEGQIYKQHYQDRIDICNREQAAWDAWYEAEIAFPRRWRAWMESAWHQALQAEVKFLNDIERYEWDVWYAVEIVWPRFIEVECFKAMRAEADVIWQRELIWWQQWYEVERAANLARASVADLRSMLGAVGSDGDYQFNAEGGYRHENRLVIWQKIAAAWKAHLAEPKKQETVYAKAWDAWLTIERKTWALAALGASIKRTQERFHASLRQGLESRRLYSPASKHARQRTEWNAYLAKLKKWRDECSAKTCSGCGGKVLSFIGPKGCARCNAKPSDSRLAEMIRNLAGICVSPAQSRKSEWDDWGSGKPGFQSCGPSSWDNSVRASEEDR